MCLLFLAQNDIGIETETEIGIEIEIVIVGIALIGPETVEEPVIEKEIETEKGTEREKEKETEKEKGTENETETEKEKEIAIAIVKENTAEKNDVTTTKQIDERERIDGPRNVLGQTRNT